LTKFKAKLKIEKEGESLGKGFGNFAPVGRSVPTGAAI
jgi:hypothetical protein